MKKTTESLPFTATLVDYLISEFFDGDAARFAAQVDAPRQHVEAWRTGVRKPQAATLRWLLAATVVPEVKVACEYAAVEFSTAKSVRAGVRKALGSHADKAGVYAFYDSMCNVIYVGKASTSLLQEMYQQLSKELGVEFPRAVSSAPVKRWQATRYVSAYEVPQVEHLDYPKHVEALILRVSKPIGNKVLGTLRRSAAPKPKSIT